MQQTDTKRFQKDEIEDILRTELLELGMSKAHANYVVDGLLFASMRGIDTHGVTLFKTYVRGLKEGRNKVRPAIKKEQLFPGVVNLDADGALGMVAGMEAIQTAIAIAETQGIAVASVKNSDHFGVASYYSSYAAEKGFACLTMSNADALVAPFNGCEKLFGTNPMSFSAPGQHENFNFDMATSQISYSKVRELKSRNQPIPSGCAVDEHGIDSSISGNVHALQPVGGYKGQGLCMMISMLAGFLNDSPPDYEMAHLFTPPFSEQHEVGHVFLVFNIKAFTNPESYKTKVETFTSYIRNSPSKKGEKILLPGDIENAHFLDRTQYGIPVNIQDLPSLFEKNELIEISV